MRVRHIWPFVALLMLGCNGGGGSGNGNGNGDDDDDDNAGGSRFDELIFVDVDNNGDYTGFTPGDDFDTTEWLTQTVDAAKQIDVPVAGNIEDFEKETAVPDAEVDLWFDDVVVPSLSDLTVTSDVNGNIGITAPACEAMAYRITTDPVLDLTKTTYKAHHMYPYNEGNEVDDGLFLSVSTVTYQLIPTILGVNVDPNLAIIAGTAYDVARDAGLSSDIDDGKIEGVQVIVYDDKGNIPPALTVNYFTESFPDRDQKWTSADGLWVAANVPDGLLTVEMWGQYEGELKLLGATQMLSEPDSINISNIFAGYNDGVKYPDDCL